MIGSVVPEIVRRSCPARMSSRNAKPSGRAGLQPSSDGALNAAESVTAPVDWEYGTPGGSVVSVSDSGLAAEPKVQLPE